MRLTYQSKKSKPLAASGRVIAFLLALIWSSGRSTIPGRKACKGFISTGNHRTATFGWLSFRVRRTSVIFSLVSLQSSNKYCTFLE